VRKWDVLEMAWLSAVWGASFLFMRVAVPEMGTLAMVGLRVGIAAAVLLPIMVWMKAASSLQQHFWRVMGVGLLNSALPFLLFAFAAQSITAGFASILNATAPFWAALVAWVWLGDRLTRWRVIGLLIGFSGVVWLAGARSGFSPQAALPAVGACLLATLCYGLAASYSKRFLPQVNPIAAAAGSQLAASIVLLPFAITHWPSAAVSVKAWGAVVCLAVVCTGLAYISYFRLIRNVGPSRAIAVTFVIPVFGVLWGALLLDELVTMPMVLGGMVILLGTALTTGVLAPPGRFRAKE
jgi:drug/metabolite transporter (DMT)-like permease